MNAIMINCADGCTGAMVCDLADVMITWCDNGPIIATVEGIRDAYEVVDAGREPTHDLAQALEDAINDPATEYRMATPKEEVIIHAIRQHAHA